MKNEKKSKKIIFISINKIEMKLKIKQEEQKIILKLQARTK